MTLHGPAWKNGKTVNFGYTFVWKPDHPRAKNTGYVREHILIAERALGKYLPINSEVHHFPDKTFSQLVICENHAYHHLLHLRYNALKSSKNVHYRKCRFCKGWDDPKDLYINPHLSHHRQCANNYRREKNANIGRD